MVPIHNGSSAHIVAPRCPLGVMLGQSPIHIGHLTVEPEKCQPFQLAHQPQDLLQRGHLQAATPLLGTLFLCILLVLVPWLQH